MSGFDERKQKEEGKYKHDQELMFKARNRGNKLFGLWIAEKLGLSGDAADAYAKDVVMADFDAPGDDDVFDKVKPDLARKIDHHRRRPSDEAPRKVPGGSTAADQGGVDHGRTRSG